MAKDKTILDGLAELDAGNEDHWTGDGLPDLKSLREKLGYKVTRAEVTEAAPFWTKDHPSNDEPVEEKEEEDDKDPSEDEAEEEEDTGDGSEPVKKLDPEKVKAELDEAEAELARFDVAQAQANKYRAELVETIDRLRQECTEAGPVMSQAEMVKQYQRSQHNQRRAAAGLEPENDEPDKTGDEE